MNIVSRRALGNVETALALDLTSCNFLGQPRLHHTSSTSYSIYTANVEVRRRAANHAR
jgi:hypothetical protein